MLFSIPKKRPNNKLLMIATLDIRKWTISGKLDKSGEMVVYISNSEKITNNCNTVCCFMVIDKDTRSFECITFFIIIISSGHCIILFICPYERILKDRALA